MEGEDRDVEWLPPAPAGDEPPRFDPSAPDPLPPAPPPPPYVQAPPPTAPPVHPPATQEPGQSPFLHPPPPPVGGAPPPAGPPVHHPPPPAWQQAPSAPWPHAYGKPPGNSQAVWSLILGIAGLVAFVFPAGFGLVFVFNLPTSVAAWVLGVQGRRKVDRGQTHEHRRQAQAGVVLGIIGVVLGVLAIVGWTLAIILSDEVRDELRRSIEDS